MISNETCLTTGSNYIVTYDNVIIYVPEYITWQIGKKSQAAACNEAEELELGVTQQATEGGIWAGECKHRSAV